MSTNTESLLRTVQGQGSVPDLRERNATLLSADAYPYARRWAGTQGRGTQGLSAIGREQLTPELTRLTPSRMSAAQVSTAPVSPEVATFWQPVAARITGKVTRNPLPENWALWCSARSIRQRMSIVAKSNQGWFLPLIALMLLLWLFAKPVEHKTTTAPISPPPTSALSYSPSSAATVPEQAGTADGFVNADTLNVRDRPNGRVISKVSRGGKVRIYERAKNSAWARISADGVPAQWVSASSLCDTPGCHAARSSATVPIQRSEPKSRPTPVVREYSCSCSGGNVCIGPRGGRYCITSGGNKRYGV